MSQKREDLMKLSVSYQSGTRYDIASGKHRIVTDQALENGGQDAGPTSVVRITLTQAS
jgi:hypothetical protein